ncbi:hypothetical protein PENNAL_c0391G03175, partial [Penicillium nalgiovense]
MAPLTTTATTSQRMMA